MRLAIITYNSPHLKTEQVSLGLHARGHRSLHFFALPFKPRPSRNFAFSHRPDQTDGAETKLIAGAVDAEFTPIEGPDSIPVEGFDYYLISGSGLLPETFVDQTLGRVINCHPGIIPLVRGLDAFKWAIHDRMPLGNTLHFISAEADAGEVLAIVDTPVFATDTMERLARRHYEQEIHMMIAFDEYLKHSRCPEGKYEPRLPRMRMPKEIEASIMAGFGDYKTQFAQHKRSR